MSRNFLISLYHLITFASSGQLEGIQVDRRVAGYKHITITHAVCHTQLSIFDAIRCQGHPAINSIAFSSPSSIAISTARLALSSIAFASRCAAYDS
jgi:hypothetical protein